MSTVTNTNKPSLAQAIQGENVVAKFEKLLGDKENAAVFLSNLATMVNQNKMLTNCSPKSLLTAAVNSVVLNLPITPSLGQAAIVPYRSGGETLAQFQIMSKGWYQLFMNSGLGKTLTVTDMRVGELKMFDPVRDEYEYEIEQDPKVRADLPVEGYLGYMRLTNGFDKFLYMTVQELEAHGAKYSASFNSAGGMWKKDFDTMARKTVQKLLINRHAPVIVSQNKLMARAIKVDQGVYSPAGTMTYRDNPQTDQPKAEKLEPSEADQVEATEIIEKAEAEQDG